MRDVHQREEVAAAERWKNLAKNQRGVLNRVFHLNRRVFKAYLLKESLEKLWDYRYEGAMLNYLQKWIDQLRLAALTLLSGPRRDAAQTPRGDPELLPDPRTLRRRRSYHGNIRMLINRGRGYKKHALPPMKAQRMAVTNTEYVAFQKTRKAA